MNPSHIPSFCVVGQSNQGKTTLLATLTEDDRLGISNMPGTTTAATDYPVKVGDEIIMVFWDTPGFENSADAHQWFQEHADRSQNPSAEFIGAFRDQHEFRKECEIFKPISEGAAVIFVVDLSQRVRETDRQQIAILRQCGSPRLAVTFSKDGKDRNLEKWTRLLTRDFNIRIPFNAHTATISDRFRLLERIQTLIPEWEGTMDKAIRALKKDQERKRSEAVSHLLSMLQRILKLRKSKTLNADHDRKEIHVKLEQEIRNAVLDEEVRFRKKTRETFGHSDEHWTMPKILSNDVFSKEVRKVLGLTKTQLTMVGATIGGIIGGFFDAHVGGASWGLGAAIGAAVVGATANLGADRVALITFPGFGLGPFKLSSKRLGGVNATAQVHPKSALFGVLIDRGLLYIEQAINRPHGLTDDTRVEIPVENTGTAEQENEPDTPPAPQRNGLSRTWSIGEHKIMGKFIGIAAKNVSDPIKLDDARAKLKRVVMKQLEILTLSVDEPTESLVTVPVIEH